MAKFEATEARIVAKALIYTYWINSAGLVLQRPFCNESEGDRRVPIMQQGQQQEQQITARGHVISM